MRRPARPAGLRSAVDGGAKGRDAFFLQQFDSGEPFGGDRDFDHNARHGIAQTFGLFHHALRVAAHGLREEGALRTDGFCRRGSTSQTGTLPAAIMLGLVVTPASG